jgi:electron transport complex protein RnfC
MREREKSDIARQRFEFRKKRLEREQREKAEQMRKRKEALSNKQNGDAKAAIQAALERVRAKKEQRAKTADGHTSKNTGD